MSILCLTGVPSALADSGMAKRWWNVLSPEQMVAALYGDKATEAQARAARKMNGDLDADTKKRVDAAAGSIHGKGGHDSVPQGSLEQAKSSSDSGLWGERQLPGRP